MKTKRRYNTAVHDEKGDEAPCLRPAILTMSSSYTWGMIFLFERRSGEGLVLRWRMVGVEE